jgi:hypothetical protein
MPATFTKLTVLAFASDLVRLSSRDLVPSDGCLQEIHGFIFSRRLYSLGIPSCADV